MPPRILLVEDEEELHDLLKRYLIKEGYEVDSAMTGPEAVSQLATSEYHLVILDLMLPLMDGYDVLGQIRKDTNLPVLIISSKNEEVDKIVGLRMGADDYLTKPFGLGEFLARVKALLRRYLELNLGRPKENESLQHAGISLNLSSYEVEVDGELKQLTATEFSILKLLMSNISKVLSKHDIFKHVWNQKYVADENTIMVHMRRLRVKIEKDPSHPRYIHTIWGIGYKFETVDKF
ncbi:response regulator transcription factor [Paenibacillus sp.]|jgi:DNA-binding response OmpR family regulator|uniref:response regulator transcription factor n=1 Tax=Paenibacillus sp. TaxID=58172 RepID=UPI0028263061|nr:response regulator transcription factor [Paenibacillus sp.]MDR0267024.1 response regulator transcription factor [Paenibacillus sp.]